MLALTNGKIWTGAGFARTVLIEGNRILALDAPVPSDAEVIDLRGRLAVPGFIDNHVHFILGGLQLARVSLRDARSPEELARRIAAEAKRVGRNAWVLGTGWDEQLWSPAQLPTRALIDSIENPVFVTRLDIHLGLANSAALRLAGITRDTPDPAGGTIVRDESGEPTGVLKDAAMQFVTAVIPPPSLDERMAAARAALALAASLGVTAFCDMGMTLEAFDDFRAYQRLEREGALTARIALYAPIGAYERLKAAGVEKRFGSQRLRIGGLKGFADGSLGSSTAAFFEPFSDDACNCGLLMAAMSDGRIARWTNDADAHELQITIHAIGDRANADVLSLFESRPNHRQRRFRIEHAQHLTPELIERFAKSGVIASMQPYHAVDDGRWAQSRVGADRAPFSFAFRSLIDAGALVTFGSDWSVAPLDPLLGIQAAVTREWVPEQRVTVEEALRCYTVNNAYAMFAEDEIGRIAPGMLADVAVLSHDLFESVDGAKVDMTIFDGRVIFER
ncbi:MAG TPA: amidohydrolase [Thermoanaerobaculia bacterium]